MRSMAAVTDRDVVALVVARGAEFPSGTPDAIAWASGTVVLLSVGEDGAASLDRLSSGLAEAGARHVHYALADTFDALALARAAARTDLLRSSTTVVVPASPDGRDLAPMLSAELGWPLLANAIRWEADTVECVHHGGRAVNAVTRRGPAVITVQPNSVGPSHESPAVVEVFQPLAIDLAGSQGVTTIGVDPPDAATVDLAEAERIFGVGDGLGDSKHLAAVRSAADALGCSVGGTRVVTDAGWMGHDRQIGTTGVVVNPELYLAFGISGAVQHTAGLGDPTHIVSVNTDPHCPMMKMADLAIVADAADTATALSELLDARRADASLARGAVDE